MISISQLTNPMEILIQNPSLKQGMKQPPELLQLSSLDQLVLSADLQAWLLSTQLLSDNPSATPFHRASLLLRLHHQKHSPLPILGHTQTLMSRLHPPTALLLKALLASIQKLAMGQLSWSLPLSPVISLEKAAYAQALIGATDSGSACNDSALKPVCIDSALKPASTMRVNPADSDPSAAKLPQCGPDEAAKLIESQDETSSTNIWLVKPQCKTHHNLKPQPLVNAFAARCGSGSSMSSQEQSGGPACISNEHANPASARSDFASTSNNVELDTHSADQHA